MMRTNYTVPLRVNTKDFGDDISRVQAVLRRLSATKVTLGMDVTMNGVAVAEAQIRGLGQTAQRVTKSAEEQAARFQRRVMGLQEQLNKHGLGAHVGNLDWGKDNIERTTNAVRVLVNEEKRLNAERAKSARDAVADEKRLNEERAKSVSREKRAQGAFMANHRDGSLASRYNKFNDGRNVAFSVQTQAHAVKAGLASPLNADASLRGQMKLTAQEIKKQEREIAESNRRLSASIKGMVGDIKGSVTSTRKEIGKMLDDAAKSADVVKRRGEAATIRADKLMNDFFARQVSRAKNPLYFTGKDGDLTTHPFEENAMRKAVAGGAPVSDTVANARRASVQSRNDLDDSDARLARSAKFTQDFNTHLGKMRTLLDDTAQSRARLGRAFDDNLEKRSARVANNLRQVGDNAKTSMGFLEKARLTILSFGTSYLLISGIGDAFRAVKDAIFDFPAAMEVAQMGLQGLLRTTREQAGAVLDELKQFAIPTPFETQELVTAANQAIAFGLVSKNAATAGRELVSLMTDLGDASFGLGRGKEGVDRILLALGQMKVATRVMSQEMLQLQQVGINAWQYLAEGTGKTTAEVRKLVKDGMIPADAAIKTIRAGLQRDFGGMMVRANETLIGSLAQLKDSFRVLLSDGTSPFYRELAYMGRQVAAFVSSESFSQWLTDVLKRAMEFAQGVRAMGSIVYQSLTSIDPAAAKTAIAFFAFFKAAEAIFAVHRAIGALKVGMATLGGAQSFAALFGGGTVAGLLAIAPALIAITAAVTAGYLAWDFYSDKIANVAKAQKELATNSQALDKTLGGVLEFTTADVPLTKKIIDLRTQMLLAGNDTNKLRELIENITRIRHEVRVSNKLNNSAKALIEYDLNEAQRYAKQRPILVDAKMSAQSESFWQNFFQKLADATGMGQVTTDITQTAAYAGAGRIIDPIYNFFNPEGGNLVGDAHYEAQAALARGSAHTRRQREAAAAAQARQRANAGRTAGTELFPGSNLFGITRESLAAQRAAQANAPKTREELLAAAQANKPKPTPLPKITPTEGTAKKGKSEAEKAADKERARLMKIENDRLADAAQLYDRLAKAAEDSARRQIEALGKVGDSMRDLIGGFQESLLRSGHTNNPLSQIISRIEGLINLPGRVTGAAATGLGAIGTNQLRAIHARQSLEKNQGKDGNIPAAQFSMTGGTILQNLNRALDSSTGRAACASFASKALRIMGVSVQGSPVARDLVNNARRAGAREIPVSQAGAGDLIYQYGPNKGVLKDARGNGYHVGVGIGNGRMMAANRRYVGGVWRNARALDTSNMSGGVGGAGGMPGIGSGDYQDQGSGTGEALREMLANFNPNLSKIAALPREWTRLGGAVKDTEQNTARFTAQMMLADRVTTDLLRNQLGNAGFSQLVKLLREAANETDRLNNLARGNEAVNEMVRGIGGERRMRALNERGIYGARADYVARRQDPRDPLHNAAPHLAMRGLNEVVQNSYEKAQAATRDMRVEQNAANRAFAAGLPVLRAATFNAYAYNQAVEEQAEKIRIRNELIKEGLAEGTPQLNSAANERFSVWRNGQRQASGNAREVDWAGHTQALRDVNERTTRQLQTVNDLTLSESELNESLDKQAYYYEQIDRLSGLGHSPERAAELATYSALMWEGNKALEKQVALMRTMRQLRIDTALTLTTDAARRSIYGNTVSGSIEQQRALANASSEAELQGRIARGEFNTVDTGYGPLQRNNSAIDATRDAARRVNESSIQTQIAENRSQNDLSARNQMLDTGLNCGCANLKRPTR
jgi:tape measure domain-containing protein